MPHYSYSKTFTHGKDKRSQQQLTMPCTYGVLTDVIIHFPAGCFALTNVTINDGLHQVFPTNPSGTYALDDFTIAIEDKYNMEQGKSKLILKGWNEDEEFDHTIKVAFRIIPYEEYSPVEKVLLKILSILERLFGKARV